MVQNYKESIPMNTSYTILPPDPRVKAGSSDPSHARSVRQRFPFHRSFAATSPATAATEEEQEAGGLGKEQQQLPMAVLAQLSENPELRAAALKIVTNMKVRLTLDQCPACGRKRQEQDLE